MSRYNTIKINKRFTIGKTKCSNCFERLAGEKGFINLNVALIKTYYGGNSQVNLCMGCWRKIIKDIEIDKRNGKQTINKLTQKAVMRNLKK